MDDQKSNLFILDWAKFLDLLCTDIQDKNIDGIKQLKCRRTSDNTIIFHFDNVLFLISKHKIAHRSRFESEMRVDTRYQFNAIYKTFNVISMNDQIQPWIKDLYLTLEQLTNKGV